MILTFRFRSVVDDLGFMVTCEKNPDVIDTKHPGTHR